MMKLILQVFFYSLISGVFLSCAIPNELYLLGCPIISFIAIIPYYLAIKKSPSYKVAFWCGFIQAITTHLISSYWLAFFKDYAIFTLGGSALATGLFGGYFGILAFLPYALNYKNKLSYFQSKKKFYQTISFKILYFCVIYVCYEYVKSSGFLGYPWGTISSTMYNFPIFMQIASITGTYGITFLTVFANLLLVEFYIYYTKKNNLEGSQKINIFNDIKNPAITFLILFSISMLYGVFQYYEKRNPVKSIRTLMVQHNLDPWNSMNDESNILKLQALTKQALFNNTEEKPQLIVWSEGAILRTFPGHMGMYNSFPEESPLIPFIQETGIPLITGGSYSEMISKSDGKSFTRYYNSTLLFNEQGELKGHYAKIHLVPFAELIPGIENPIVFKLLNKIANFSSGWTPGKQLTYFNIKANSLINSNKAYVRNINIDLPPLADNEAYVKISTPICFDDAFTDTMRPLYLNGSEVFYNVSDDSWSLTKSSEYQHFVIASYRAIEYRTTLVRTTNAGYTVVVDPAGKILGDLPLFEASTLIYDVPVFERKLTTYAIFGNWLPVLCIIFFFLVFITSVFSFSKTDFIESEKHPKNKNSKSKK